MRPGGLPDNAPVYSVESGVDRGYAVIRTGFRGGRRVIATYNYYNLAERLRDILNQQAKSEVFGHRISGTGKKKNDGSATPDES